jgi:hypothetical protein
MTRLLRWWRLRGTETRVFEVYGGRGHWWPESKRPTLRDTALDAAFFLGVGALLLIATLAFVWGWRL